jgi:hypothetical protein
MLTSRLLAGIQAGSPSCSSVSVKEPLITAPVTLSSTPFTGWGQTLVLQAEHTVRPEDWQGQSQPLYFIKNSNYNDVTVSNRGY